jgi:DNA-binding LacI/PurR family transcriptional regulator
VGNIVADGGVRVSVDEVARPTKADVARLANVSTATVSHVLNNVEGRTSAKTQAAVRKAAAQLGYRPNLAARNLARGRSGVVLYVVPAVAVGQMPMEAGSLMTKALARRGIMQIQQFETEDDQNIVDAIADFNPIAVASLFPLGRKASAAVAAAGIPLVHIGGLPLLGQPHLAIGELRVAHLVSRGHRKLAFAYAGSAKWRPLGDFWLSGIRRAARQRKLPAVTVGDITVAKAAEVVTRWVEAGITAVCAQSDDVAFVVLHGIREAGLRCPDDLAVMGVDATSFAEVSAPPLTTVSFDATAVADVAVSALLSELGYPTDEPSASPAIATLITRQST